MESKLAEDSRYVIGMRVDCATYEKAADKIISLAESKKGGYVCTGNAHMALEANRDAEFRQIVNSGDLVTPDGMPLVFLLKLKGIKEVTRVDGPDLTLIVCEKAQENNIPTGFYGGTEETLRLMMKNLKAKLPLLNIVYAFSPPFRTLKKEADEKVVEDIKKSGAMILFIGLGCPKQEIWMAEHRDRLSAVMIGVGAAFDFISGTKRRAPRWMQKNSLEWLWRLIQEPQRLWKRYLIGNTVFIWLALKELINEKVKYKICKKI